jgi:hypothetical protein
VAEINNMLTGDDIDGVIITVSVDDKHEWTVNPKFVIAA